MKGDTLGSFMGENSKVITLARNGFG